MSENSLRRLAGEPSFDDPDERKLRDDSSWMDDTFARVLAEAHRVEPSAVPREHEQRLWYFRNGYGASVVRGATTYGGPKGLWELAVLRREADGSWGVCYDTPVTKDVEGYLTLARVVGLLRAIQALPAAKP